ncbi:hypothetical protein SAY86_005028 [Trapa natans]|uniref:Uncharacterized protein n=1 Tax=Trapa natans TaxID=22666 RepID=A0AAN7L0C2_TRANT|nr:hypothetical protein SAY86_005028 [Trapa natans]
MEDALGVVGAEEGGMEDALVVVVVVAAVVVMAMAPNKPNLAATGTGNKTTFDE